MPARKANTSRSMMSVSGVAWLLNKQIPHRHEAKQFAGAVHDVAIGDHHVLQQLAQGFDGLTHAHIRCEHRLGRLHHAADGVGREILIALPLLRQLRCCGIQYGLAPLRLQRGQNVLYETLIKPHQRFEGNGRRHGIEQAAGRFGTVRLQSTDERAEFLGHDADWRNSGQRGRRHRRHSPLGLGANDEG